MSNRHLSIPKPRLTETEIIGLVSGSVHPYIVLLLLKHHHNACRMYLIGTTVMNSVSLSFNVTVYLYTNVYGDPAQRSLIFHKLRNFLLMLGSNGQILYRIDMSRLLCVKKQSCSCSSSQSTIGRTMVSSTKSPTQYGHE